MGEVKIKLIEGAGLLQLFNLQRENNTTKILKNSFLKPWIDSLRFIKNLENKILDLLETIWAIWWKALKAMQL